MYLCSVRNFVYLCVSVYSATVVVARSDPAYVGCFQLSDELIDHAVNSCGSSSISSESRERVCSRMTRDECSDHCREEQFFGMADGEQCFCSDGTSHFLTLLRNLERLNNDACTIPCEVHSSSPPFCGGPNGKASVYRNSRVDQEEQHLTDSEGSFYWPNGIDSEPKWAIRPELSNQQGVRVRFVELKIRQEDQLQIIADGDVFVVNQAREGDYSDFDTDNLRVYLKIDYRAVQPTSQTGIPLFPIRERRSIAYSEFKIEYTVVAKCKPPRIDTGDFQPNRDIYFQGDRVDVKQQCGTSTIICNENGDWSELPTCTDASSTNAPDIQQHSNTNNGMKTGTSPALSGTMSPKTSSVISPTGTLGHQGDTAARSEPVLGSGTIAGIVVAVFLGVASVVMVVIIYLLRSGKIGKDVEDPLRKSPKPIDDQTVTKDSLDNPAYSITDDPRYSDVDDTATPVSDTVEYSDIPEKPNCTNNLKNNVNNKPPNIDSVTYDNNIGIRSSPMTYGTPPGQQVLKSRDQITMDTPDGKDILQEAEYHVLEKSVDEDESKDVKPSNGDAAPEYLALNRYEESAYQPLQTDVNVKNERPLERNDGPLYFVLDKDPQTSGGKSDEQIDPKDNVITHLPSNAGQGSTGNAWAQHRSLQENAPIEGSNERSGEDEQDGPTYFVLEKEQQTSGVKSGEQRDPTSGVNHDPPVNAGKGLNASVNENSHRPLQAKVRSDENEQNGPTYFVLEKETESSTAKTDEQGISPRTVNLNLPANSGPACTTQECDEPGDYEEIPDTNDEGFVDNIAYEVQ